MPCIPMIQVKRIYEKSGSKDGARILVDRIWPRGLSKAAAGIDLWLKEVAPSTELRQWFNHDPARREKFRSRHFAELAEKEDSLARIREALGKGKVTLVYSAKDEHHNNAVALKQYLAQEKTT